MEIVIANQKGHKTLLFSPIGYVDKIVSDESRNEFIKESDRTNFEFVGNCLESNLDVAVSIAIKQKIKNIGIGISIASSMSKLSELNIESISFDSCIIDYKSFPVFDMVKYLTIGNSVKMDISFSYLPNLVDITFLSVKTFKGKILDKIESVEKLILWYENKKSNEILSMFPNLKEFYIYNGSIVELDLSANPLLERLQLHRCIKLEKVILNPTTQLKDVIVEACKKLDAGNLGDNVRRV
jgi:hypothetical protein